MSDASTLKLLKDYRAERSQLFPSDESLRWTIRQHRDELVSAGALVCPTGRWLVQPAAFDKVMVAIGTRRARR